LPCSTERTLLHGGGDLLAGELGVGHVVAVRGAPAPGHHLDLVGTGPQHLAGGPPDLVGAIGDDTGPDDPVEQHRGLALVAAAQVGVPAGLGERAVRHQQPGTGHQPALDGGPEAGVGEPGVADGREALAQGRGQLGEDLRGVHRARDVVQPVQVVGGGQVGVGVDQPGQDGATRAVDDVGVAGRGRARAHAGDAAVLDADPGVGHRLAAGPVDQRRVQQVGGGHGTSGRRDGAPDRTRLCRAQQPRWAERPELIIRSASPVRATCRCPLRGDDLRPPRP
jgi:hypothetical protein